MPVPVAVAASIPQYPRVPVTREDLEYAGLPIIDLSMADTYEGRVELAKDVTKAMTTIGFFYIINHGLTQAQNDRMFDIANVAFDHVSEEEKQIYTTSFEKTGQYIGYKPRQQWHIKGGVSDQIEQYNMDHDIMKDEHPKPLRPFLSEMDAFSRHCHFHVVHSILRLLAIGLELPDEEALVNVHQFSEDNESAARFMKYYPRTDDEEFKTDGVWLKGHTDIGSISVLWSQPISALQILGQDGKWRWIRHIDNALVINAGDVMEFLSGGYYKATIHRVVQPPADQRGYERLGVFYFCKADDNIKLVPFAESPVLQRVGIKRLCDDEVAPTMLEWRKSRTAGYGVTDLKLNAKTGHEEETVEGVLVTHYN
ncbi:Clavaminate synthase-like protein [Rhodofomes roseus]|uniref:Clavaminate synthase-like protein n=1 Tax=Rhodofomes roseus TaxID=34475 RepID=A0ABQ8KD23_9APHY|nr:Clavaminate synthase-like protein [Rhodofomes roseus]KAH9835000.1 Clavaminate synthase-like protein [Rhodofomes roseus]